MTLNMSFLYQYYLLFLYIDPLLTNHETIAHAVDSKTKDTVGCDNTKNCVCNLHINPAK